MIDNESCQKKIDAVRNDLDEDIILRAVIHVKHQRDLGTMMELNVIMDNCVEKNENCMVIPMFAYMIELKNFKRSI